MTKLYNRASEKAKRQQLQRNMTNAEFLLWQKLISAEYELLKAAALRYRFLFRYP
jgi:hypothetical protein